MINRTNVKLNLGLNVLRRRPDGFHDLETLFVPYCGYGDDLEIVENGSGVASIEIIGDNIDWDPQKDLTMKAWRLLHEDLGIHGVHIRLEKHAPVGAGLGGGSADAAFTLKMLDGIFGLGLGDARLAEYAARLGSDCAFFIYNRPMIGEGRGEILTPCDLDLSDYEIRVEIPQGVSVSTAEAYRGVLAAREAFYAGREEPAMSLRDAIALPLGQWEGRLVNDFEATIFPLHPEIAALKQKFYDAGAVYAAMSGSGSSVFGIFEK